MTRVLGIDPSLTGTGLALVDTDDRLVAQVRTIRTVGHADDTISQRMARLDRITAEVSALPADVVVIEGPSLAQKAQRGTFDRAGLWWLLVDVLLGAGRVVVEVPPTTRAKYATGKGNAAKTDVLLAVARRYPWAEVTNDNEADALVLAAMGCRALLRPLDEGLPKAHLAALDAVTWPAFGGLR